MTLTKSVVLTWTVSKDQLPQGCTSDASAKLAAMTTASQTDGIGYSRSPQISEWRFIDQASAEEYLVFLSELLPCSVLIDNYLINSI